MSRAMSRSRSNSGSAATAAERRAMKLGPLRASAFCRPASAIARWAFSLNAGEVATCNVIVSSSVALVALPVPLLLLCRIIREPHAAVAGAIVGAHVDQRDRALVHLALRTL